MCPGTRLPPLTASNRVCAPGPGWALSLWVRREESSHSHRLWAMSIANKQGSGELTVARTGFPFLPAPAVLPSWGRTMNLVVLSVFPFSVQVTVAGGQRTPCTGAAASDPLPHGDLVVSPQGRGCPRLSGLFSLSVASRAFLQFTSFLTSFLSSSFPVGLGISAGLALPKGLGASAGLVLSKGLEVSAGLVLPTDLGSRLA